MGGGTAQAMLKNPQDPLAQVGGNTQKYLDPFSGLPNYLNPMTGGPSLVNAGAQSVFGPSASQITNPIGTFNGPTYGQQNLQTTVTGGPQMRPMGAGFPQQQIPGGSGQQPPTPGWGGMNQSYVGQQPYATPRPQPLTGGYYNQMTQMLAGPGFMANTNPYSYLTGSPSSTNPYPTFPPRKVG